MHLLLVLVLLFGVFRPADSYGADTDGDGRTDEQELAAGTDPANDLSVEWVSLGAWRFNEGSLASASGGAPLLRTNLSIVPGFDGSGVRVNGSNGVPVLTYPALEADGSVNVAPKRGSIWFYVKPDWYSDLPEPDFGDTDLGLGPQHWATVFETDILSLKFNPEGSALVLTSRTPGGGTVTNLTFPLQIRSLDTRPSRDLPGFPLWYNGLLTYSPEETSLTWLRAGYRVTGTGIANSASHGTVSIGATAAGGDTLEGVVDEVIAFNVAGAFETNTWQASATASPAGIELTWDAATNTVANIKRTELGRREWRSIGAAVGTNFLDRTAVEGVRYEYNVNTYILNEFGDIDPVGQFTGGARNGAPIEQRGKLILLVDQTLAAGLEPELSGFIRDLAGDGWEVARGDMPRQVDDYATPGSYATNSYNITNVIAPFIQAQYAAGGSAIKQLLVLGHVTVPYSGTFPDDGHFGQHEGAWPTDLFYGDMDGAWTDLLLNVNSFMPWNLNYPGDGKYDQNFLPRVAGAAELEIPPARIDLAQLPAFSPLTEVELLKRYLRKNAAYRRGETVYPPETMAFDTHIVGRFSPIPDRTAREMGSQLEAMNTPIYADPFVDPRSALVAVVSGPGGFDNINALMPHEHNAGHIAAGLTSTNHAFYFVRSSFMPDWNTENNLLRAILAGAGGGLASAPILVERTWRVSGLGLGQSLGYHLPEVLGNWRPRGISLRTMEIQGDATLRYPVLPPPGDVTFAVTNNQVSLAWAAAPFGGASYHVYRSANGLGGGFERANADPVAGTSFVDLTPPAGQVTYMVRALGLAVTGAGTFTNISQGAFAGATVTIDPGACCIADQTTAEDVPLAGIAFGLGELGGDAELTVSSSDTDLLPVANIAITGAGNSRNLTLTPAENRSGLAQVGIAVRTASATNVLAFSVTVLARNDAPSFFKGPDQTVAQASPARTVPGWATGIDRGAPDELTQAVTFQLTPSDPTAFESSPTVSGAGTLRYHLKGSFRGTVTLQIKAVDNGGTANGGADTSAVQSFTITAGLAADTDLDGLPDDYENAYGFSPGASGDAALDPDGDAFSTLQEFWAGTNPLDSTSLLEIGRTAADAGGWRLSFGTVRGKSYDIEYNDQFPAGAWQPLFSQFPGVGGPLELADLAGSTAGTNRIYRVRTGDGNGNTVTSGYAGFHRIVALGNSDTLLSEPFIRPPEARGTVQGIDGNELTISGAPAWETNRWVRSPTQPSPYYLMICSGALEGDYFAVSGNSTNTVELDLDGGTLAGLGAGDRVAIVPYWTFGTIFPDGRGIHVSPFSFLRSTEVFFPDIGGSGINLSPKRTFYYSGGIWQEFPFTGTNASSQAVLPDLAFWVRHNVATNTAVTLHGAVLHTKFRVPLRRRAAGEQDNFVALPRPAPVSLGELGLVESGAFRTTLFSFARVDELFLYRLGAALKNRSPADTFFFDGQWRKFGAPGVFDSAPAFTPGRGLILRLDPGASSVMWINSPNY